jgi:hypothetical protein
MNTPIILPPIIEEQIIRLKKRGRAKQLEILRSRLPEVLRPVLDDILANASPDKSKLNNLLIERATELLVVPDNTKIDSEILPSPSKVSNLESEITTINNAVILTEIQEIKGLLEVIQQTTGFRTGPSLKYEGLQEQVRIQLVTDNVRMENALLDTNTYERFGEELAFRRYCVFAFYQVEELLNLYYHTKYGDDLRALRNDWRALRPSVTFDERCTSLTGITAGTKIFAYTLSSSEGDTMNSLRNVRNMEEHRCTTVLRKYASDIPKLQIQYDALQLKEKIAEAKKNGRKYDKSSEEKEIESRLSAIRFLTEPASNTVIVRGLLKRLYEAILILNKKAIN